RLRAPETLGATTPQSAIVPYTEFVAGEPQLGRLHHEDRAGRNEARTVSVRTAKANQAAAGRQSLPLWIALLRRCFVDRALLPQWRSFELAADKTRRKRSTKKAVRSTACL